MQSDDSIVSIHCYVKSKKCTIYRNNYELKDRTGRSLNTTQLYSYTIDENDPESITIFHENATQFYNCRAPNITNIMDLVTSTLIRYLEMMLLIKVIKISVDYVIDQKSQVWLMWTSDAQIVYGNQLNSIPNIPSGDRSGRMSWAGPKYFENLLDDGKNDQEGNHESNLSSSTTKVMSTTWQQGDNKAEFPIATSQLQAATITLDNSIIEAQLNNIQDPKKKSKLSSSMPLSSPRNIYLSNENAPPIQSTFPDPFKCHGDYCHIQMKPIGSLTTDKSTKDHTLEKLFTSKELTIMRKNSSYPRMMDFAAVNGPGLAAITQKSIILARQERRGLTVEKTEDNEDWRHYPITPRQNSAAALRAEIEQATNTTSKADRESAARSAQADRELKAEQVHVSMSFFDMTLGFSEYVRI